MSSMVAPKSHVAAVHARPYRISHPTGDDFFVECWDRKLKRWVRVYRSPERKAAFGVLNDLISCSNGVPAVECPCCGNPVDDLRQSVVGESGLYCSWFCYRAHRGKPENPSLLSGLLVGALLSAILWLALAAGVSLVRGWMR